MYIKRILNRIEPEKKTCYILIAFACLTLAGILDWIIPKSYYTAFFYFFPITFTTWFAGKKYGNYITVSSAIVFIICNRPHLSYVAAWNTTSVVVVFFTTYIIISKVREMWGNEYSKSRNDHLTGLFNSRAFRETVDYEIERFKRGGEPFSVCYIDLDGFKKVNDSYGHKRGDDLLKLVAKVFQSNVRKTDVVARMGGDEFAIFLPTTNHEAVKVVVHKLWKEFLYAMNENNWPTTLSMGVVTFEKLPSCTDDVIYWADNLMYQVKGQGKNMIEFMKFTGEKQLLLFESYNRVI